MHWNRFGPVCIAFCPRGQTQDDLADILVDVLHGRRRLEHLSEYERRHRDRWRFLLGLEPNVEFGSETDEWLRRNAKRLVACLPASEPQVRAYLTQFAEPATMHH